MADTDPDKQWLVACQCGWRCEGTRAEVVSATQEHGQRLHNMRASEEDVMAMAAPLEEPSRDDRVG